MRISQDGDLKQMNGCRIGATDGEAIRRNFWKNGWTAIRFRQRVVICQKADEMIEKLDADELVHLWFQRCLSTASLLPFLNRCR